MRPLDLVRNAFRSSRELAEVRGLHARLLRHAGDAGETRDGLCARAVRRGLGLSPDDPATPVAEAAWRFCQEVLSDEGLFQVPDVDLARPLSTSEVWELRATLARRLEPFERRGMAGRVEETLALLLHNMLAERLPPLPAGEDDVPSLSVPLHALMDEPAAAVEAALGIVLADDLVSAGLFGRLRARLEHNIYAASGIDPDRAGTSRKPVVRPTEARGKGPAELVAGYLGGTPLADLLDTPLPFAIPREARFEHAHVVGGSGHGKTQLLQALILRDLPRVGRGRGSVVVIDGQGDMIRAITRLAELGPDVDGGLADRLVLVDPDDIAHPPALNLFDLGLARLERHGPVERERLANGAVALYEYVFGALLGAELTQRQGVIFRYLARLLMVVPGATVHTLLSFVEDPEAARPHLPALDPTARHFFETQFFSRGFDDTRRQIATRLWGVLSNPALARMFAAERNRLDLAAALDRGSLVLVNTAKDLLKQEGCAILGRFFIALIAQAAQERAAVPAERRLPTLVYVDEAQDYLDASVEQLLNQARKYKVGLTLAHQNLGQLDARLSAAVAASTAVKLAGGVSARDAAAFAREMRCEPEFLQGMRKRQGQTEFACFVRNLTPRPIRLTVPLGQMEERPRMGDRARAELLERNRARYCIGTDEHTPFGAELKVRSSEGFELGKHDVL